MLKQGLGQAHLPKITVLTCSYIVKTLYKARMNRHINSL